MLPPKVPCAWPVPGRDSGLLVGEEHAIPDVPAARDGPEGGWAVDSAVHAVRPMAAEPAGCCALVGLCRSGASRAYVLALMRPSSVSRARLALKSLDRPTARAVRPGRHVAIGSCRIRIMGTTRGGSI